MEFQFQTIGKITRNPGEIASVKARTWYELSSKKELMALEKEYSGRQTTQTSLTIGSKRINFYLNSGICDGSCDKIISTHRLSIKDVFTLPVILEKTTCRPYELVSSIADDNALAEEMKQALIGQLEEQISPEGEIVSTEFAVSGEGSSLVVTMRAECEEPIGVIKNLTEDEIIAAKNAAKSAEGEDTQR